MKSRTCLVVILVVVIVIFSVSCSSDKEQVIIYTSVDQVFSEPVLKSFQEETGIEVLAVYDVEASKSTGLANRLKAEKDKPRADVYWSGEFIQTMMLKNEEVLARYISDNAGDIPLSCKDSDGFWTGFGGRARVLLVNSGLIDKQDYPKTLMDLLDSKYPGDKIGLAYPLFGTTSNHVAALYASWGRDATLSYFEQLNEKGVMVVDGNSVVRDMVADGRLWMGLTDTDDALSAIKKGDPVELVFLDQEVGGLGTFVIPNTVALIDGGPNGENGRLLIDYLISKETEKRLYDAGWFDLSLRDADLLNSDLIKGLVDMTVNYEDVFNQLEISASDMREVFLH